MDIVKKYLLNTHDFQIYFDNEKKTHVALNLETGEKTNIGVLGIFLQMGILKELEEVDKKDVMLQRLDTLEEKVNRLLKVIDNIKAPSSNNMEEYEEATNEIVEEKKPRSEVAEKIMEKTLKKMSKEEVKKESGDELKNWLDV